MAEHDNTAPPVTSRRRPKWREVAQAGPGHLGDPELLAVLLAGGRDAVRVAEAVLSQSDGLVGLASAVRETSIHKNGLGRRQAAVVASAFELGRRVARSQRRTRPRIVTAGDVFGVVAADLTALGHEELHCLPLDAHSRLIGEPRAVSRGDVDGTDAGPRAFFRQALLAGASSVIAVHNHPTGDPTPSAADRAVTLRLVAAGRAIDLPLTDHVVIGDGGRFVSLRSIEPGLFR